MENNKALKTIISVLVIVVFALGGFYFGKKTAETENLMSTHPEPVNQPEKEENKKYEFSYNMYEGKDKGTSLFLKDDNSFVLYRYDEYNGQYYVGTYNMNDYELYLKVKTVYSGQGCFYKEGTTNLDSKIFEEIKVTHEAVSSLGDDDIIKFKWFDGLTNEYKYFILYYSISDIDLGFDIDKLVVEPTEDKVDNFVDCTNKDKI